MEGIAIRVYLHRIIPQTPTMPVLEPTFGILDWTFEEICNLDIRTSKLLTMLTNSVLYGSCPNRLVLYETENKEKSKYIRCLLKRKPDNIM